MQNHNPLFVTQCLAVDRMVNGKRGKPEQDFDEQVDSHTLITVVVSLWMGMARALWRAARRVHLLRNAPVSESVNVRSHPTS